MSNPFFNLYQRFGKGRLGPPVWPGARAGQHHVELSQDNDLGYSTAGSSLSSRLSPASSPLIPFGSEGSTNSHRVYPLERGHSWPNAASFPERPLQQRLGPYQSGEGSVSGPVPLFGADTAPGAPDPRPPLFTALGGARFHGNTQPYHGGPQQEPPPPGGFGRQSSDPFPNERNFPPPLDVGIPGSPSYPRPGPTAGFGRPFRGKRPQRKRKGPKPQGMAFSTPQHKAPLLPAPMAIPTAPSSAGPVRPAQPATEQVGPVSLLGHGQFGPGSGRPGSSLHRSVAISPGPPAPSRGDGGGAPASFDRGSQGAGRGPNWGAGEYPPGGSGGGGRVGGGGGFECRACSREYKTRDAYQSHLQAHKKCDSCNFEAIPKFLKEHELTHYLPDELKFSSEEDIGKWRDQRKKKYPTAANVQKKEVEQAARLDRGQVAQTPLHRYVSRIIGEEYGAPPGRGRGGRGRERGRGRDRRRRRDRRGQEGRRGRGGQGGRGRGRGRGGGGNERERAEADDQFVVLSDYVAPLADQEEGGKEKEEEEEEVKDDEKNGEAIVEEEKQEEEKEEGREGEEVEEGEGKKMDEQEQKEEEKEEEEEEEEEGDEEEYLREGQLILEDSTEPSAETSWFEDKSRDVSVQEQGGGEGDGVEGKAVEGDGVEGRGEGMEGRDLAEVENRIIGAVMTALSQQELLEEGGEMADLSQQELVEEGDEAAEKGEGEEPGTEGEEDEEWDRGGWKRGREDEEGKGLGEEDGAGSSKRRKVEIVGERGGLEGEGPSGSSAPSQQNGQPAGRKVNRPNIKQRKRMRKRKYQGTRQSQGYRQGQGNRQWQGSQQFRGNRPYQGPLPNRGPPPHQGPPPNRRNQPYVAPPPHQGPPPYRGNNRPPQQFQGGRPPQQFQGGRPPQQFQGGRPPQQRQPDNWPVLGGVQARRPTLLEKLLAPEIRREQNTLLQCIRHVVREEFSRMASTSHDQGGGGGGGGAPHMWVERELGSAQRRVHY